MPVTIQQCPASVHLCELHVRTHGFFLSLGSDLNFQPRAFANIRAKLCRSMLLVSSNNYVTRRQSLKLLSELLLDRSNFAVMTQSVTPWLYRPSARILTPKRI